MQANLPQFMDSNRRDKIPGAEKKDYITDSTASSIDFMFVSVPLICMSYGAMVHMSYGAMQKDNGE